MDYAGMSTPTPAERARHMMNAGAPPIQPQSKTDVEMKTLALAIDTLENAVSSLTTQLNPVLREVSPAQQTAGNTMAEEVLSPLASKIRMQRQRVATLSILLSDLQQGLEI